MKVDPKLVICGLVGIWAGTAWAEELVTDRPDATESSSVVQSGQVQLELGWLYTESGDQRTHELPQTLVRIGVIDRVELRIGWDGYVEARSFDGVDGAGDGELGTKIYLSPENGAFPESALLAAVSIPWGDQELTSDEVDPAFRFAFSHTLPYGLSLGYNLGAEWATEDDSTLSSFVYTVALGFGLTDSLGGYIEFFGDVGLSAAGDTHSFDGGLTYLISDDFQLDVLAGVGISDNADDWFAGAGVSYRFSK